MVLETTDQVCQTVVKSEACRQFIQAVGNLCRRAGLPRSLGQIYGLLFLSPRPLSLDDLTATLQISKASASTGTRQLVAWGAVRQIWVPGHRRDHFEALTDVGGLVRHIYHDFIRPRLAVSGSRFDGMLTVLEAEGKAGQLGEEDLRHLASRIGMLAGIQKRIEQVMPLVERLL